MSGQQVNTVSNVEQGRGFYPWFVCLVAALFFFYEFFQLNAFNSLNISLSQAFQLSPTALGKLSSLYFFGNLLTVVPAGLLLDRFSVKKIILIAMVSCTIFNAVFALSDHYIFIVLARIVQGLGAGFCFIAPIRLASRWFPTERLAFVTGVIVTMAMIGGMVAQAPFAKLIHLVGWREAMMINTYCGVAITFLILMFVRDVPRGKEQAMSSGQAHLDELGLARSFMFVLRNPQNWLCALYTALLNLPIFLIGALWGIPYLEARGYSEADAALAATALFLGAILGSPFYGWLSDRMGLRRRPMIVGVVLSLLVMLAILYLPTQSTTLITMLFGLLGFVTCSQVLSYPVIVESNPSALTSSATSVISLVIMLSGLISQPLFGWLMELANQGQLKHFTTAHFFWPMMMMPIACVLAWLMTMKIRETHGHPYNKVW